jgi:hypothetical protein
MPEQPTAVVVTVATMVTSRVELSARAQRIIEELADEHLQAWCVVAPVDARTWAIVGSLPYEGEVILAEFDDRPTAELALEELAALDPDITIG